MLQLSQTGGNFGRNVLTGREVWVSLEVSAPRSGLDAGVEESINVDDILQETPLGLRAGLSLNVVLHGLVNLSFVLGLDLDLSLIHI